MWDVRDASARVGHEAAREAGSRPDEAHVGQPLKRVPAVVVGRALERSTRSTAPVRTLEKRALRVVITGWGGGQGKRGRQTDLVHEPARLEAQLLRGEVARVEAELEESRVRVAPLRGEGRGVST